MSINVQLSGGGNTHVSFSPLTGGGSVYYTDNEQLIDALERHPKFGRLFKVDPTFVDKSVVEEKKVAEEKKPSVNVVKVAAWDDAKEYLVETYGISRTKLRSHVAIEAAAAAHNIKFEGI